MPRRLRIQQIRQEGLRARTKQPLQFALRSAARALRLAAQALSWAA